MFESPMFKKLFLNQITKIFLLVVILFCLINYFFLKSKKIKIDYYNIPSLKKVYQNKNEEKVFLQKNNNNKNYIKEEIENGEKYLIFFLYDENCHLLEESKLRQDGTFSLYYKTFFSNGKLKTIRENYHNSNQIHFIKKYNKNGVLCEGETFSIQGKRIGEIFYFPDEGLIQENIYHSENDKIAQILEYSLDGKLMRSLQYFFDYKSLTNNIQRVIEYDSNEKILKITDFYQHFKQKVIYESNVLKQKSNKFDFLNCFKPRSNIFYNSIIHS
jgi:hypothetical protein